MTGRTAKVKSVLTGPQARPDWVTAAWFLAVTTVTGLISFLLSWGTAAVVGGLTSGMIMLVAPPLLRPAVKAALAMTAVNLFQALVIFGLIGSPALVAIFVGAVVAASTPLFLVPRWGPAMAAMIPLFAVVNLLRLSGSDDATWPALVGSSLVGLAVAVVAVRLRIGRDSEAPVREAVASIWHAPDARSAETTMWTVLDSGADRRAVELAQGAFQLHSGLYLLGPDEHTNGSAGQPATQVRSAADRASDLVADRVRIGLGPVQPDRPIPLTGLRAEVTAASRDLTGAPAEGAWLVDHALETAQRVFSGEVPPGRDEGRVAAARRFRRTEIRSATSRRSPIWVFALVRGLAIGCASYAYLLAPSSITAAILTVMLAILLPMRTAAVVNALQQTVAIVLAVMFLELALGAVDSPEVLLVVVLLALSVGVAYMYVQPVLSASMFSVAAVVIAAATRGETLQFWAEQRALGRVIGIVAAVVLVLFVVRPQSPSGLASRISAAAAGVVRDTAESIRDGAGPRPSTPGLRSLSNAIAACEQAVGQLTHQARRKSLPHPDAFGRMTDGANTLRLLSLLTSVYARWQPEPAPDAANRVDDLATRLQVTATTLADPEASQPPRTPVPPLNAEREPEERYAAQVADLTAVVDQMTGAASDLLAQRSTR